MIGFRRINLKRANEALLTQRFARNNDLLNYGYTRDAFLTANVDEFAKNYRAADPGCKMVMRFVTLRGRIIGHVWLAYTPDEAKVDNLFLCVGHRQQGHGARILRWAERDARRRGYNKMVVGSSVTNEKSRRFYYREGWRIERKSHSGHSWRWSKQLVPGARGL